MMDWVQNLGHIVSLRVLDLSILRPPVVPQGRRVSPQWLSRCLPWGHEKFCNQPLDSDFGDKGDYGGFVTHLHL